MYVTKVVEKIKTHFLIENCAVYEIMGKNVVEPDVVQMTI